MSTAPVEPPSPAMCWLLAALSFGAGAIHLVMVPQHAEDSLGMGLAFAMAGWFQIAFGVAMLARPGRRWVLAAIVANLAFLAIWAISRTAGLPQWTGDRGLAEVSSADVATVVFEGVLVIGAVALLVAPRLLARWRPAALTVGAVIPAAIVVATTAVLASPSTAVHAHGGDTRDDAATVAAADHHEAVSAAASDDHHGESDITYDELPKAARAEVDQVIEAWATKYPTAADARADGWFMGTQSLYGIGAHYIKNVTGLSVAVPFDLLDPPIMLFDGDGPDAKFAGVSYVVAEVPEGFTGPYDFWHQHESVCRRGGSIVSVSEEDSPVWYSESECVAAGGSVFPITADTMIHVWIGPDYIDDAPIFAHDHPKLYDGFNPKRDT